MIAPTASEGQKDRAAYQAGNASSASVGRATYGKVQPRLARGGVSVRAHVRKGRRVKAHTRGK